MPDATAPSIGSSALIGALLGGGLGAGASAFGTAERPNETRTARMKRILRNALVGGTLGAGAGAGGGAVLGMVPRINNPKSWIEKWHDLPMGLGHPVVDTFAGYGIGNRISAGAERGKRLEGVISKATSSYNDLLGSQEGQLARNALEKPPAAVAAADKNAVDALWKRIIGGFNLSGSHEYSQAPAAGSMKPVPTKDTMEAVFRGLFSRSKNTVLPGGTSVPTFVDTAARKAAPDFSRYDFAHAPGKMDRLKYETKSTLGPTKGGLVGALIGGLGPTVLSHLGTAISNLREE